MLPGLFLETQMDQATLAFRADLDTGPPDAACADRTGFDIGWDHARHGLAPALHLLTAGSAVGQGWLAARAVLGHRRLTAGRHTRACLALRLRAWQEGGIFDQQRTNATFLAQIEVRRCPVLRTPLGGPAGQADAPNIERLNPDAPYAPGNLLTMSRRAAQASAAADMHRALRLARAAEHLGQAIEGLDAAAWWRLVALRSFVTPLPLHELARLPLAVLPHPSLHMQNPVQILQTKLTQLFLQAGWSGRTRALAQTLPAHTVRTDFNLFVGALAPRVIEASGQGRDPVQALEDAWLHERVQRRWQHLVLSLGEAGVAALLARATRHVASPAPTRLPSRAMGNAPRNATA